jgi:hypothetical protein
MSSPSECAVLVPCYDTIDLDTQEALVPFPVMLAGLAA